MTRLEIHFLHDLHDRCHGSGRRVESCRPRQFFNSLQVGALGNLGASNVSQTHLLQDVRKPLERISDSKEKLHLGTLDSVNVSDEYAIALDERPRRSKG